MRRSIGFLTVLTCAAAGLPALSADQGYWDTATQWPLLQESVMAGSKTPQQAVAMYQSDWKTG